MLADSSIIDNGFIMAGIGAMAIATILGGIVFSGEMIDLAGRWRHALSEMAYAGIGGSRRGGRQNRGMRVFTDFSSTDT